MRKLLAILIAAALALTLCACAGTDHRSIEQDAAAYIGTYGVSPKTNTRTTNSVSAAPQEQTQPASGEPAQTQPPAPVADTAPAESAPAAASGEPSGEASGG